MTDDISYVMFITGQEYGASQFYLVEENGVESLGFAPFLDKAIRYSKDEANITLKFLLNEIKNNDYYQDIIDMVKGIKIQKYSESLIIAEEQLIRKRKRK